MLNMWLQLTYKSYMYIPGIQITFDFKLEKTFFFFGGGVQGKRQDTQVPDRGIYITLLK